jgi:hypothetical protein
MTTSDVERRLADVLQRHAEDAMNHTDTDQKLETLLADARRETRHRRRTRAAAAVVAAAAAIAVFALVTVDRGADRNEIAQAETTTPDAVAMAFLDAYGSFDQDKAASYLADDAETSIFTLPTDPAPDPWREYNTWLQAVGFQLLDPSCVEDAQTPSGSLVLCGHDFHAFGSDELGRGPFLNELFKFTVRDGEIVTVEWSPSATSGFGPQMWDPFAAWVVQNYPDDAPAMYEAWPDQSSPALTQRSIELWEQHVKDYVAAQG